MNIISFLLGFIACFGLIFIIALVLAYKDFKNKKALYERIKNKGK